MSQYFLESKQPIFFSFYQTIKNNEIDLDFEQLIKKFQENFENEQHEIWLKYWNKQGEERILETWNQKYKKYLKEESDVEVENKTDCHKQEEAELEKVNGQETCETDLVLHEKFWEDLWQEHREEVYCEQYLIFTTIFYNYFLDLKNSCETPLPISGEFAKIKAEEGEVEENESNSSLATELEQLRILGLPTSFGGRPQNSSKKDKNSKKPAIAQYSDFFSDSDTENDLDESDVEEYDNNMPLELNKKKDSLHNVQKKSTNKIRKRKRNRQLKNVPSFILEEKGLLKYWRKRFSLFSRFDEGIRLDRESWFSVTPEKVAKHLAERLKCSIILDGFCGSGGNVIQFALTCDKVIAIDIDPIKLEMAKHNANIYKVAHKIEFILGDYMQLAASGKLKADVVFLSPPWGGPDYKRKKEFDIEKDLLPVKASQLLDASRNVSENIALFLPRKSSVKQIVKLAGIGNRCEIEHNYLDSGLVAITALYGEEILKKDQSPK